MIRSTVLAFILLSTAAIAVEAPRLIETDPVTGATVVRSMRPLEALPKKTGQQVARYADSVRDALEDAMGLAEKARMPRLALPETMRGSAFRGVNLTKKGPEVIVDSAGPDDPDLAGRLAWALWVVRTYGDQPMQFSLDPVDMSDFRKGSAAVYMPYEALAPFQMGRDVFEADMDLKYYALGYERDGTTGFKRIANPPPGYRDQIAIAQALHEKGGFPMAPVKARLWIVCDTVFVSESDSVVRIDSVRVRVHARRIGAGEGNTFVDVGEADPLNATFAAWFEAHYADLVPRHPELAAIVENAKALALARWMEAKRVGPGDRWVAHLLPVVDSAIARGPALTRRDTLRIARERSVVSIELAGGVEMVGSLASNRSTTGRIRQDLAKGSPASPDATAAGTNGAPKHRVACRRFDESSPKWSRTVEVSGERMEIAAYGMPVSSTGAKGGRTTFRSGGGKVRAASIEGPEGFASLTRLADGGSHLEIRGRTRWIQADYDAQGGRTALWEYPVAR